VHTRFVTESGWCARCKRRVRSRHPDQISTAAGAAGVSIGPNAKAVAADLHHRLGIPYGKVAEHFRAVSGLKVTRSALCQSSERLADTLRPVYENLIALIRKCCAAYVDETGWRIGALSAWLWVFTSQHVTVYVIDESRGHEVVVEILGRKFKGTLIGDCFRAYDHRVFADWVKQKCFAHLLKDLKKMEADKAGGAVRFPREVAALLRQALALADEKPGLSTLAFARRFNGIQQKLDALVAERRNFSDPDNRRFAERLRKQRCHLFTFLTNDQVEATNNRAERMLRPAVIVRKTGGCNKTQTGARTHSVIASVLATARQNAVDGIRYIAQVLTAPFHVPLLPIPALDSS
jgi:transposase